ncbi:hypothetical protein H2509_20415 [Stappia sp. F7233]|uniref:DUF2163 domain-containing protein n=1 Tax=Stappia albiluteola TaxID=2758565 RepID=A0A839AID7_9HYPH|nr:hypothetical protein [Stappia albiluteola]MBA5779501.1 hypothetical protein [Stappia albiluteola]
MQELEAPIKSAIDAGRVIRRDAILFDLAEGLFGFWWGEGPLMWNGIRFEGTGSLLKVDTISTSADGSPTEVNVSMSAIPNSDLTPDVLASIEQYTYHQRPARIYSFLFSPETGLMLGTAPKVLLSGKIDGMPHEDRPGAEYTVTARIVSRSDEYRATGYAKRSVETQTAMNGGMTDKFYDHAARASQWQLKWGRT